MDKGKEAGREFVVADGNSAELLELMLQIWFQQSI